VSSKDERGKPAGSLRGLYCTNCHNHLAHELYRYDNPRDAARQEGKFLRNRPIEEVIRAIAGGDQEKFKSYYANPTVGAEGDPLYSYYAEHKGNIFLRGVTGKEEKMAILPWNADRGKEVAYASVSAGDDGWFAPGEPHCGDCHVAPFVESEGGKYFPIDQPKKYSLYRYSKAHGALACQSCHQSMHGLYPVRSAGEEQTVDWTSYQQALQFSPDKEYAGPVTCTACHMVNRRGVPVQLRQTEYETNY
jgi:mono/diheme cytochrome c family protein